MKIIQLRCFIILSETLSFSHTAEILHLTQSAVSYQIKRLESILKFQLFNRNNKSVELTEAGKYFYRDATEILSRLTLAINNAAAIDQGLSRTIKISYGGYDLERYNLPEIIAKIKEELPKTEVMVLLSDHREQRAALLSHKAHIILTPRDNIEDAEGVIYKEIISSGLDCIMSERNPLHEKTMVNVEDLAREKLMLLDPTRSPRELSTFAKSLQQLLPESHYTYVDSSASANILIKSNSGVALIPEFARSLDSGLCRVPFNFDATVSYGVAWLKENDHPDVVHCARLIHQCFQKA